MIVGCEILPPVRRQRVLSGIDHAIRRNNRLGPLGRTLREPTRTHRAEIHLSVQVKPREDSVGGPAREPALLVGRTRGREHRARRIQLRLDEAEERVARHARRCADLRAGDEGNAPEEVHQHVVVPCAQGPQLGERLRRGRSPGLRDDVDHQVGASYPAEEHIPRAVHVLQRRTAARRPVLPVDLEPAPVVVPVLTARRNDHLVRADLAQVVVFPHRAAELCIDRRDAGEHFRVTAKGIVRRERVLRHLGEVRARHERHLRRHDEQHPCRQSPHRSEIQLGHGSQ